MSGVEEIVEVRSPGNGRVDRGARDGSAESGDWERLERFLAWGDEERRYRVGASRWDSARCPAVVRCIRADGVRVVDRLSCTASREDDAGLREAKVLVLALVTAHGDDAARALAYASVGRVCRTGAEVLQFAGHVRALRGWGRGVRRAVGNWYRNRRPEELAEQVVRCRRHDGWSHGDLLRLSHPVPVNHEQGAVFRWILSGARALGLRTVVRRAPDAAEGGVISDVVRRPRHYQAVTYPAVTGVPALLEAVEHAGRCTTVEEIVALVRTRALPVEGVPERWLRSPEVWDELFDRLELPEVLARLGEISGAGWFKHVEQSLVRLSRRLGSGPPLHPIELLMARRGYESGLGWEVEGEVVGVLDAAFHEALGRVRPVGRPVLVALDVSGSMARTPAGESRLTAKEASVALALALVSADPGTVVVGFTSAADGCGGRWGGGEPRLTLLDIRPGMRLEEAMREVQGRPFGGMDCALPMEWARRNRFDVGGFVVVTDSETWSGKTSPGEALARYRVERVSDARAVVLALSSGGFAGRPGGGGESGVLEIAGFDATVPRAVGRYLRSGLG